MPSQFSTTEVACISSTAAIGYIICGRYLGRCSEVRWIWSAENSHNDRGAWLSDIPPRTGRASRCPSTRKEKMGMADLVVSHGPCLALSLIESTFTSPSLCSRVVDAKTDPDLECHWRDMRRPIMCGKGSWSDNLPLVLIIFDTSNIGASIWFHQ